jgi:RNA polymerase sigma factor (sigma-70 family)
LAVARIDALADESRARVTEVVARHERTLLRVARQASLCHDDALDAYQRALEIFVRRVDTVERETEVAWLKVVVRHEAMAIRRARVESVTGEELDLDAFVPSVERSVEDRLVSEERVRRSAEALRALKPDEAKALMMKAHGLSYAEIGERNGWSYTKVNRAVTEGRRRFINTYNGIEAGEECERFEPIVQALSAGSATTAQVLKIRPHLRHCHACRATVRELHVSRLHRASLFSPALALTSLKHDIAALFHRAQASDLATGTGLAGAGGGGRVATVGAVLGLCLGGAGVGTVCVVNGGLPGDGGDKPAHVRANHEPRKQRPREATPARREPPVVAKASPTPPPKATATPSPAPKPKASTPRKRRRRAAKEAAPREFSFENQATTGGPAEPSATTASQPPPTPTKTASKTFSPAEQEFLP